MVYMRFLLTTFGFEQIGRELGKVELPVVLIQEGGYISDHLGANLSAVLRGFEATRSQQSR